MEGQPCTQQSKESTVQCAWLQNLLKIKAVVQTEVCFPPKVKIPLGLCSLQRSLIIHFVWENLRLLLATEYLKCTKHRTYCSLGKGYSIGRYLDKLSYLTLLARTYFYGHFFHTLSGRCGGVCGKIQVPSSLCLTSTAERETWNLSYSCLCLWLSVASNGCCCLASETPAVFQFYSFPKMNGLLHRFFSLFHRSRGNLY